MKGPTFVVALLITAAACVSLTPEGAKVRLTNNPEVVRNCTFIQNVTVHPADFNEINGKGTDSGAVAKKDIALRNAAAAAGGDTVISVTYATGEVYRCSALPAKR